MSIKLSIIIPFYNVEKYISECLDSVFAQDIPETEYEVICVNDCSPDGSRNIVLDYQKKHKNIVLIEHKTNMMLGAARNTGIRAAKGEYITFLDSDDYILTNTLRNLTKICDTNQLEILHFNMQRVNDFGIQTDYLKFPKETETITGIQYLLDNTTHYWNKLVTACGKLFKREFITKNDLFFPTGVYFEDNVHTLKSTLLCTRFKYITDAIYMYRDNAVSIMNQNLHGGIKMADKVRAHLECVLLLSETKNLDEQRKDYLVDFYKSYLINWKKTILYLPTTELNKFYKRNNNIDAYNFKCQLNIKDSYIYVYPIPVKIINFVLMQPLRIIRKFKRKITEK